MDVDEDNRSAQQLESGNKRIEFHGEEKVLEARARANLLQEIVIFNHGPTMSICWPIDSETGDIIECTSLTHKTAVRRRLQLLANILEAGGKSGVDGP